MNWLDMDSAPRDGTKVLLLFYGGIISSGAFRYGNLGEPRQNHADWRTDCCGRFSTPLKWCILDRK